MLMFLLIQLGRQYKQEMDVKTILKQVGEQDPARVYKIELANRNIKEITALKLLDKVRCLVLNFNLIERIQNLQFFQDLRQLHLEYNAIQKIQALQSNKNLQVLTFSNNRIEKIQNIAHLIRLETLVLDCNKINKLTGLEYLKELKHLSARNNAISAVQNLPSFSKLITLNLAHNKINNISATFFGSSKTLSFLDLSHNKIENTSFLQPLVALQNLNLSSNNIEELKISPLPNLQSLNLSKNRLQKIPNIVLNFPQLMSLNISFNMICSEHDLLVALGEIELLTQIDFRQNPMHTQTFENALQKIHRFDFLNGKIMTKAGAKYYQQVDKIKQELDQNSILYGQDDEKDRQIKMSGFYDDELEFRMSGMKVNRPQSPAKKKKNLEKATFYDDIDRVYNQFVSGDQRIKIIREQYLKICGNYNISSQHIITEPPLESQHIHRVHSMQQKTKEQIQSELSQQYITNEKEIYKQTQKNLNKWKELKQREKSFNIRDVIKKSRGKDSSINKGATATSGWGATGLKPEKMKSQLLRTQALPKKGQQIFKTVLRPSSMRKKQ